jgi:hypothetical protein
VLCPTKDATDPELPKYRLAIFDFANSSRGRRMTLARWIASDENPLTARVIVNRLWHYHFGRGTSPAPATSATPAWPRRMLSYSTTWPAS